MNRCRLFPNAPPARVLGLYRHQRLEDSLHRSYQRSRSANVRAQVFARPRAHFEVSDRPPDLLRKDTDVWAAIAREKQIKGWRRERKIALIETMNPKWADLTKE